MEEFDCIDEPKAPFFGAETTEVNALRALASVVVDYLNGEAGREDLEEGIYVIGQTLIGRYSN